MLPVGWGARKGKALPVFPKLPRPMPLCPMRTIMTTCCGIDQQLFPLLPSCAYKCIITIHVGEGVTTFGAARQSSTGQ